MKIVFYLYRFPAIGGIENVTTFLANAFVREGHVVEIISHIGARGQERAQIIDPRIQVLKMPESGYVSRSNRVFIREHIAQAKPDVIIFQDSYAPIENNLFSVIDDVPLIVCEHNAPYVGYVEEMAWGRTLRSVLRKALDPVWRRMRSIKMTRRRQFLYKVSRRYVLLSNRFFGEFRAITELCDSRKLLAIPNPNLAENAVPDNKQKENEIIFVGAVNFRKGCDMLLKVWERIAARYPDWRLTVVGDGSLRADLEARASVAKIPRVQFEGYRTDPTNYFRRARLFAFPSRREGWGLVIQEAQSYGCVPVVFDSFASVRDVITDCVSGAIVPAFDCDAFAIRLEELIKDPETLERLAQGAIESVARHKVDDVLNCWRQLLLSIANSKSRAL